MKPITLEVSEARKKHGETQALDGVSLRLEPGEWAGLLGPNGAGKTTLMRAIAGLGPLDAGRVEVCGRPAGPATRGFVGFVPQELALYGALTARENLEVFARWHGVAAADEPFRVDWALEWTGLADRADHRVDHFSGGMKRRLNIASGVLHEPRLVLLDEPTVGVDPQGRQRIWRMLDELRQSGAALLQSTHQLDEIEQACDRFFIADHGRIVAEGELGELVARHAGGGHAVEIRLTEDRPGLEPPAGLRREGESLRADLVEPARELPELLRELERRGLAVRSLHLRSPGLENVFTELTGRELRE